MNEGRVRHAATPARRLALEHRDGVYVLGDVRGSWVDGGEDAIRQVIAATADRSSLSAELARAAHRDWDSRYHFSPARSNIVRGLDIPSQASVLEVGAGCGAITRYLGETCAVVDAVEPTAERAAIAALRTQDLDSVAVFQGSLAAIPSEPAYDLVVLVGVLEYVGGRDGWDERVTLLREAGERLRDGGSIACAIENRLGVQYLAGAPEDHLAQPFAGLEDYPRPGPVRTFDRPTIERLFREAGFEPTVLHAFPDYKFARTVFHDSLLEGELAPLAWRMPHFPSTGSPHRRPRLASEYRLWRSLVGAGLGGQFANSFLVLGARSAQSSLWPPARPAALWSATRAIPYLTETHVVANGSGAVNITRRVLAGAAPTGAALRHIPRDAVWSAEIPLLEQLEDAPTDDLGGILTAWRRHVESTAESAGLVNIDIWPGNVLGQPGERLTTIDEEWFHDELGIDFALGHGLLNAVLLLVDRRAPERWPEPSATVRDVFVDLAGRAGLTGRACDLDWISRAEAALISQVTHGDDSARDESLRHLRAALDRPLHDSHLGVRDVDDGSAVRRAQELHETVVWLHREVATRDQRVAALDGEVAARDQRVAALEGELAARGAAPPPAALASARALAGRLRRRLTR